MDIKNVYLFLAITTLSVGLGLAIIQLYFIIKSINAKNWLTTEGTITHSEVEVITDTADNNRLKPTFKASIIYCYKLDKTEYTSSKIFFGDSVSKPYPFQAKQLIQKYFTGKTVNVFYNPIKKSQALLEPGLRIGYVFYLIAGLLIIVPGIIFLKLYFSAI